MYLMTAAGAVNNQSLHTLSIYRPPLALYLFRYICIISINDIGLRTLLNMSKYRYSVARGETRASDYSIYILYLRQICRAYIL
jgi:hypothetical protein